MGTNKRITLWSAIISVISVAIAISVDCEKYELVYDLSLGLFTGAILSFITALICYFRDKRLLLFQTIDELNKIYRLIIRFKPYRKKYAVSSLEALKTVLETNLNSLGALVHEYDAFSKTDVVKYRSAYNCLVNLRDKHLGIIESTWAMIEMDYDEEMIQQNYTSFEKDIVLWVPFEDGIGKHGKNLIAEKVQENIEWLIALHNKKHIVRKYLCKIMERVNRVMKKKIPAVIASGILLSAAYLLLDIINIPSRIGLDVSSVNWDSAALILGNIIVIGLFLVTYFLLDRRSVEKENNQREIAKRMILSMFDSCIEMAELFDDEDNRAQAIKHCDFYKLDFEDAVKSTYLNLPFEHHDAVLGFATSGVISAEEFEEYMKVQKEYKAHVNLRILLFDEDVLPKFTKEDLLAVISAARQRFGEDSINA